MRRIVTILTALFLLAAGAVPQASAQDNTLGGAIIGGAATGKAGGAIAGGIIGAAAGAALGSEMEPRRGGYYWYDDYCWRRWHDGSYHRTYRRYCYDD